MRSLGNCKGCDKGTTETGKSKETIREIIIRDNPPGIRDGGVIEAVSIMLFKFTAFSVVPVVSFRCFGGFAGFVSVFRVLVHTLSTSANKTH